MSAPIMIPGRRAEPEVTESLAPQIHRIIDDESKTCLGWQYRPNEMVQFKGIRVRREGILLQTSGYTQQRIRTAVAERFRPPVQTQWNSLVVQTVRELSERDRELLKACEGIEDLTQSLLIQVLAFQAIPR